MLKIVSNISLINYRYVEIKLSNNWVHSWQTTLLMQSESLKRVRLLRNYLLQDVELKWQMQCSSVWRLEALRIRYFLVWFIMLLSMIVVWGYLSKIQDLLACWTLTVICCMLDVVHSYQICWCRIKLIRAFDAAKG